MVLSIGSLVDLKKPLGSLHGEAYHHLARASVCEIPLMEEPDFDVLHALVRPSVTFCSAESALMIAAPVLHDLLPPHFL